MCWQNLEGEIKRWKAKYCTELEDRETEIQKLQAKRAMKYDELQKLSFKVSFNIKMYSTWRKKNILNL
jgi:hypothetical protein